MGEIATDAFNDEELLAALSKVSSENALFAWFDEEYPYPWQRQFFDAGAWAKQRMCIAANGVGKALKNGTSVLTPNGFVPIETLRIGDTVIGGDGQPCNVIGVYPQGHRETVRVTFDD